MVRRVEQEHHQLFRVLREPGAAHHRTHEGLLEQTRDQMLIEYVRNGETFANWTALLTIQQFRRKDSPHEYLEKLKGVREAGWPGVTEWTTVSEDKTSLVYEWKTTAACGTEPPQWEVARLMFARNTAYRLAFTSGHARGS